jgi:GAF domain-containing protein
VHWSWLATPYLVCAAVLAAVGLSAALLRGDRVLRLGVLGAAVAAVPWAVCQGLSACTRDPEVAWRILRLGQGPLAMVGPTLMLVLLGVTGQLERYRWIARAAGLAGLFLLVACWTTRWTVPSVQFVPAGIWYIEAGPLTAIHISQLGGWLVVGILIARAAAPRGERRQTMRLLLGVLVFGAVCSVDLLLLYHVWSVFPIAWAPATIAGALSLHLVLRTDFLRPQGFDRTTAVELALTGGAVIVLGVLMLVSGPSLPVVMLGALIWAVCSGIAWTVLGARRVRVIGERDLEQFVARTATLDDETKLVERLGALWATSIRGLELQTLWWRDGEALTQSTGERWPLDPELVRWLVQHSDPLALSDLATMRVGAVRGALEALGRAHDADVIVPLVDRDELVGLVEVRYQLALREAERGLLADSARAAARAVTFISLARTAARERETAREVEIADALRLQASASRDAELGAWSVAAEYRTAPRTTGAGWSALALPDGRLALLVTEAQAHGVAAALATAALTGAFAAATSGPRSVTLDALISSMRASSEGVLRGGTPVAAFLAIVDGATGTIEYTCAGHPGAYLVGASTTTRIEGMRDPGASMQGARRHTAPFPPDTALVITSSALRGPDDKAFEIELREASPAAGRLATVLVENALRRGEPSEDLLAVVVRAR